MPHLHFHDEGRPLFVHQLRPARTLIGRSDRCDVALPSDSVSRVHCGLERRVEGWWLTDRSRHGTFVNGSRIERHLLAHGDELTIGTYVARFSLHDDPDLRAPTATVPIGSVLHEDLVEVGDAGVAACRSQLRIVEGPREGETVVLQQIRTSLGGPGSDIVLDEDLPMQGVYIRVVRGRAMVEPGTTPVFLAGARVRQITPAIIGEKLRIGANTVLIEMATVEEDCSEQCEFGEMVGRSSVMRKLFGVLTRMAAHDAPVLVTGPSGTGKELVAQGLHEHSSRREGPFVAVNCAAIADNLFESELFGHEKGAFTGATSRQDGAFQRAEGGTLFLDEIGEMRLDAQAKLLRALESGEVRRVGGRKPEFPDVRVVAATNRDLPRMAREGTFRADLYFRLAVLTVRLPPLSERRQDVSLLARTLLDRYHPGAVLAPDALELLGKYEWPGNVRELRNVLTRAFVMAGTVIRAADLAFHPWAFEGEPPPPPRSQRATVERRALLDALEQHDWNRTRAARELGMPRSSLLYKLKKYGIDLPPGGARR